MKKKFKITCVLVLLLSLFLFSGVNADSGWDGSYDSGGSSYSGSSSWDSDWGSSSSGSGIYISGDGETSSWVIVLIIIFIIIGIVAQNTNNKSNSNRNKPMGMQSIKPYDIENIKRVLPSFTKEEFKSQAFVIYKNIQEAWMNFDYEVLQKYTTDELFNTYKSQLVALKVKNQKNIMKDFELKDFEIESMEAVNGKVSLTVRMMVECFDYVVDKENKTIRGKDNQKVRYDYQMTFIKGISEKANKCPNCNAPLENVNSSKCPYCDSVIIGENYDWVLAKKRVVSQTENKS